MHEFGHSIGLSHSNQEDSIMYAFYQYDLPAKLSYDDLLAIRTLYGGNGIFILISFIRYLNRIINYFKIKCK